MLREKKDWSNNELDARLTMKYTKDKSNQLTIIPNLFLWHFQITKNPIKIEFFYWHFPAKQQKCHRGFALHGMTFYIWLTLITQCYVYNNKNTHLIASVTITTWLSRHQKLIGLEFNEARDDGLAVTSAGRYAIYLLAPLSKEVTTPSSNHSTLQARWSSWLPTNSFRELQAT